LVQTCSLPSILRMLTTSTWALQRFPGTQILGRYESALWNPVTAGGASWTQKFTTAASPNFRSGLPALAVTTDGQVGLLYTAFDAVNNKLEQHFVRTSNNFLNVNDAVLERFTNGNVAFKINPYLGDYMDLVAVGGRTSTGSSRRRTTSTTQTSPWACRCSNGIPWVVRGVRSYSRTSRATLWTSRLIPSSSLPRSLRPWCQSPPRSFSGAPRWQASGWLAGDGAGRTRSVGPEGAASRGRLIPFGRIRASRHGPGKPKSTPS
jgi:hypothetical protein